MQQDGKDVMSNKHTGHHTIESQNTQEVNSATPYINAIRHEDTKNTYLSTQTQRGEVESYPVKN